MTESGNKKVFILFLKWMLCFGAAALPWILPVPAELAPPAWIYAGLFLAVFIGLLLEPAPPAVMALLGVLTACLLRVGATGSESVPLFTHSSSEALRWAFSGFSGPIVWIVLSVSMLGMAFEKTGLGLRIGHFFLRGLGKSTLGLGYAITFTEGLLAFFVPSVAARSGGIVHALVMGIPPLCESGPSRSPRAVGAYLVWVAFASSCVTSSLFLTAFIPNLIALDMLRLADLPVPDWRTWFMAVAPGGILLLLVTPLLAYWFYPPDLKRVEVLPIWENIPRSPARSARQTGLFILTVLALIAWVAGEPLGFSSTAVALLLICLLVVFGIVEWEDVLGNSRAWNMALWTGAMLTLTAGLDNVGFLDWALSGSISFMTGFTPNMFLIGLIIMFFLSRYLMAGSGGYAAMLLPLFLALGARVAGGPAIDAEHMGLILSVSIGFSSILTPYAAGQGMVWFSTGYIKHGEFWFLSMLFGAVFLAVVLCVITPWVCLSGLF